MEQVQSIRSMEVAKNCLKKIAMLSVWTGPAAPGFCFGCAWDERRIQMVQIHITCPVWIHTRLILMSFSKYNPSDPWDWPKTVSRKLPCFLCGLGQQLLATVLGVLGMKEGSIIVTSLLAVLFIFLEDQIQAEQSVWRC